ncbi:recombinase family protein [Vineibacter terrae]|uniref:recombinase family protein n=1 Tax=Vineibacter terrae TaxID=2586908 RepID=UPI0022B1FAF7|nr:recombinase family protein [Vineibacter terrae]
MVSHLNRNRMFTRNGGRWGIGQFHRILTRRTYIDEHQFNKRSKAEETKHEDEVVTVAVPPLIDLETFETVQRRLLANKRIMPLFVPAACATQVLWMSREPSDRLVVQAAANAGKCWLG